MTGTLDKAIAYINASLAEPRVRTKAEELDGIEYHQLY